MRNGALIVLLVLPLVACGPAAEDRVDVPGRPGATKTAAAVRAERRAFDGSPPVIPHEPMGAACISCHNAEGIAVPDLGFAPPMPHGTTAGMSTSSRCQQCHVFQRGEEPWVGNTFAGLRQDLRRGQRAGDLAPPVIPHKIFMRENCVACHSGPAAREEVRTSHPERVRCQQCHLEQRTTDSFGG